MTRARKRRRKSIDLFRLLTHVKLIALELGTTIVFLVWVYHEVLRELR